ncbi:hypothetical protein EMCRGX_G028562 [Ephydatia muelleri]
MGIELEQFTEQVDSGLLCAFCSKVLDEPVKGKCGHHFCSQCLQRAVAIHSTCPRCKGDLTAETSPAPEDLVEQLEKLNIRCTHSSMGCGSVVPMKCLREHVSSECQYREVVCVNRGCDFRCPQRDMEEHMEECVYRMVECEVCKGVVVFKDMGVHQAVKRCFELTNKRRLVSSARRLSGELKEHRIELTHQRHLTEQAERRLTQEHYEQQLAPVRRRAQSAGPVLMDADKRWLTSSVQARVGSAFVVPHYSRNLRISHIDVLSFLVRFATLAITNGTWPTWRFIESRATIVRIGSGGTDQEVGLVPSAEFSQR